MKNRRKTARVHLSCKAHIVGAAMATILAFCASPLWPAQTEQQRRAVSWPVILDSAYVYQAWGKDSSAAQAEARRVNEILLDIREIATAAERIRLREREGAGVVLIDSLAVLAIFHENRVDTTISPLANALALRERIVAGAQTAQVIPAGQEEELLLRLLLGIVYPFSLLVILRLTRYGLRNWEKNWRGAARHWLANKVQGHGFFEAKKQNRRLLDFLTGLERLVVYGFAVILISFIWFALFPQTQALAGALLASIINPVLDLIGLTARSLLLLLYTASVIGIAYLFNRHLAQRRRLQSAPEMIYNPVVYFPLRVLIWLVALFFILFPYSGAPRLFAVGILLLALLAGLIALRPLAEEIAAGLYLNSTHGLKAGMEIQLEGMPHRIIAAGMVQICLLRGEDRYWIPYSRLLKADLAIIAKSRA